MAIQNKPRGYAELDVASKLADDSDDWAAIIRNTFRLELWITPAVREVIRQGRWRSAANPIGYVKTAAIREANSMGLHEDDYKGDLNRSRKCFCGQMSREEAKNTGHKCGDIGVAFNRLEDGDFLPSDRRSSSWDFADEPGYLVDYGPDDDYEEDEETGARHYFSRSVSLLPAEFRERRVFVPEYGDTRDEVNWRAIAEAAGLDQPAGEVLELKQRFRLTREQILASARNEKDRLRLQAAERMVSKHWPAIEEMLRQRRTRPNRVFPAPPARSVSLLRPPSDADVNDALANWERRFDQKD